MTPYDLLRDKCNELLPERLELKFGCEIRIHHDDDSQSGPLPLIRTWKKYSTVWFEYFLSDAPSSFGFDEKYIGQRVEILGPELTITDVLRALHRAYPLNDYYVTTNGTLYKQSSKMLAGFFLSAPLFHPSNAPACEAVLKLLDSEKV